MSKDNSMVFSVREPITDNKKKALVDSTVKLTKMALVREYGDNTLVKNYAIDTTGYDELNKEVIKQTFEFCAKRSGMVPEEMDFSKAEDLQLAFSNQVFEWNFFAIQTQTLSTINSDNEVQDILMLANISTVGVGDSKTFEIDSKALYDVQDGSYGNNVTLHQEHYKSSITLTPSPKDAAVSFDVMQMIAYDYDFGKQIAKIAMSFRTRMYQEIVDEIFKITNVSSTPFYEPAFAKVTYTEMAERLAGANGAGVMAYGSRTAFVNMSDNVSNGYATQDEINKNGFIGNLYGVSSFIIQQSVDSNNANFNFRVPTDRVLLVSNVGDKPVKVVKEGSILVRNDDGRSNSLYKRVYKYTDFWAVGLATQGSYGIQEV